MNQSVSVIIPTKGTENFLCEAISSLLRIQELKEIVVVSSKNIPNQFEHDRRVRVVIAPNASIVEARNLGIASTSGEIIAFTDDDCVVSNDWISSVLPLFDDPTVAIVGGPGVTHPNDGQLAKCAGAALESIVGTYSSRSRYLPKQASVGDAGEQNLSTCNLFLRRAAIERVGYFDGTIYPCEENELIWRVKRRGYRVLYAPNCVVLHHRRPIILPFLYQIRAYARGRALLVSSYPRSLRLVSSSPSLLFITVLTLPILYFVMKPMFYVMITLVNTYLLAAFTAALYAVRRNGLGLPFQPLVWLTIVLMHLCYGATFLFSLSRNLIFHKTMKLFRRTPPIAVSVQERAP